jgi:hypothetical protein
MPNMSSEQLRDISIRVVEGFLNDKVPLSEGLAKQAAANDLNPDQVQRCVEACNTISFLKIMGAAQDRTFEFPLCDYKDVMSSAAVPNIVKVAYQTIPTSDGDGYADAMTKAASDNYAPTSSFGTVELTNFMIKEAAANHRAIEDLEVRSVQLHAGLLKTASEIKNDPLALDKMACALERSNVEPLTSLVFGSARSVPDFGAGADSMFKQAELKQVATLQDLYKEAKHVRDELNARRGLDKKASDLQSQMTKQAFAAAAGRMVGGALGSLVSGAGRVAAAPVKGAFNGIKDAIGVARGVQPMSRTTKAGLAVGTVGLDSTMINTHAGYNPSGSSRDVWEALQ